MNQQNRWEGKPAWQCARSLVIIIYIYQLFLLANYSSKSVNGQHQTSKLVKISVIGHCISELCRHFMGMEKLFDEFSMGCVIRFKIHWANNCIPKLDKEFAKVTNQKLILNFKVNLHPRTELWLFRCNSVKSVPIDINSNLYSTLNILQRGNRTH